MGIGIAILAWFCFGLVTGAIARVFISRRHPLGGLVPISVAIVGALAGGFLGWWFLGNPLHPGAWILAIVVAIMAAAVYALFSMKEARREPDSQVRP